MSISFEEIPSILKRDDPREVLYVPILVTMNDDDQSFCEEICLRLCKHSDRSVRGNAILGFGHIARRFRSFKSDKILEIVNSALLDESLDVRGQADCAAMDINCYLNIKLSNYV